MWSASCCILLKVPFCYVHKVADVQNCRLRAVLLQRFDRNNSLLLHSCFEDILKKDPTCHDALAKLNKMHQNGTFILHNFIYLYYLDNFGISVSLALRPIFILKGSWNRFMWWRKGGKKKETWSSKSWILEFILELLKNFLLQNFSLPDIFYLNLLEYK